MSFTKMTVSTLAITALSATAAAARDEIRIVGSSTVFPYTQAVSEQFANLTGAASPIVESTGTGGGMKIFCAGIGEAHPDVTGASRAMKASEQALCAENGVTDITEALIGYDGLSIAVSRSSTEDWDLTLEQVYLALSAQIPGEGGLVDNPNKTWADVDSSLPAVDILAYGPPPTSGTRDAFVELAMHAGCEATEFFETKKSELDKKAFKSFVKENCSRMRQDGPFVEAGENDNLIVQRLNADANAVGIFGYSFLFENLDSLKPVLIDGVEPSPESIGDFSYPISRPLYFYVKNAHRGVIPNLQEFIEEYMSEDAMAPGGYLEERGMVTLPDDVREETQDAVINGENMDAKS
ncbi:MAG: substrate-binding domain-containing protein [Pseudomonadota bacterium]